MGRFSSFGLALFSIMLFTSMVQATFTATLLPKSGSYDIGQAIGLTAAVAGTTLTPPYTYTLYDDSSGFLYPIAFASTNSTSTQFVVVANSNGTKYQVGIKDSKTSGKAIANSTTSTFKINPTLAAGAIVPAAPSIDVGQKITLSANESGGTKSYSYQWYTAVGTSAPACNESNAIPLATSKTYSASPLSTNSYAYQVTDSANPPVSACSSGDTVNVYNGPSISLEPLPAALDAGQSMIINSTVSGGTGLYSWQWYDGGKIANATGNGTTATYNVTKAGQYHVVFTDIGTGSAKPVKDATAKSVNVKVTTTLQKPTIFASNSTIDLGQIETLSASAVGGTLNYTYKFTNSTSNKAISGCKSILADTCTFAPAKSYKFTVSVTDSGSKPLTKTSNATYVTVNPALATPLLSASNSTIKLGQSETLTASVSGGTPGYAYTFIDLGSGAPIQGCSAISESTCTFIPSSTDTYEVSVADNASTPSIMNSTGILVSVSNPLEVPVLLALNASVDAGQPETLTASVSGQATAFTYTFKDANANTTIPGCSAISTNACTFSPLANSTYTVILISNFSSSDTATSLPISVTVFQVPQVTVSGSHAADLGQAIALISNLTSAGSGAISYQWYNGTAPIANATAPTYLATAGAIGTFNYSLTVTDSNGGSGKSNPASVVVSPLPEVSVFGTARADAGQQVVFTSNLTSPGSGAITYQWYNGTAPIANANSSTYSATAGAAGTFNYSVKVRDSNNGTGESSPAELTVFMPPAARVSGTATADSGQSILLASNIINLGSGSISYQWYNGTVPIANATESNYSATAGAIGTFNYSVALTDSNGGIGNSDFAQVTVSPLPSVTVSGTNLAVAGDTITLVSNLTSAGSGSIKYQWYNGTAPIANATSPVYAPIAGAAGTFNYSVTVVDSNWGNATSNIVQITVEPDNLQISQQPQSAVIDNGQYIPLTSSILAPSGTYTWQWFNATTPISGALGNGTVATYNATKGGSYHVEFTKQNVSEVVMGVSNTVNIVMSSILKAPRLDAHAAGGGTFPAPVSTSQFSTTSANDTLIVMVSTNGGTGVPTITDTSGLTWNLQYGGYNGLSAACANSWIYYARPGRILTNEAITANQMSARFAGVFALAIEDTPVFDNNTSLPAIMVEPNSYIASTTYSTSGANDIAFGLGTTCHQGVNFAWTGMSGLDTLSGLYSDAYTLVPNASASLSASASIGLGMGVTVAALSGSNYVYLPPTISRQPAGGAIESGQTATLTSAVYGGTGQYAWQWYDSTGAIIGAAGSGTDATYSTSVPETYYVVFTDVGTGAARPVKNATSSQVSITVSPASSIFQQPLQAASIDQGQTIKLTSLASGGTGQYAWKWYGPSGAIPGASGNTINATYIASTAGSYHVVFNDTGLSKSVPAIILTSTNSSVSVNPALSISTQPVGGKIVNGVPILLTSSISGGTGPFRWQWFNGSNPIGSANGNGTSAIYSAAIPGSYRVVFTDTGTGTAIPLANVSSTLVAVTLPSPPKPPKLDAHVSAGGLVPPPILTPAFSTTSANDMILAIAVADGGTGVPTINDSAGLRWTLEYGGASGLAGECGASWVYYAFPGNKLTNDVVTAKRSGAVYMGAFVVAASNVTVFDTNSTLPSVALSTGTLAATRYSTSNANDLVLGIATTCHPSTTTWGGLTGLDSANGEFSDAYRIVSNTLSSTLATASGFTDIGIAVAAASSN